MDTKPSIKGEIERILAAMAKVKPDSEEYKTLLGRLQDLHAMRKRDRVSSDAILAAATGLVQILMILKFEQLNVISTKAMMFIRRSS